MARVVVRGDRVHRPVGWGTPSVHALWEYLRSVGFDRVPEPIGVGDTFCHGDFGPWNVVRDGLQPIAILDFDVVGPGPRSDDIAYALEYTAPFRDDATARTWHRFPNPPDRKSRIEVFAEAHGLPDSGGLVDAGIARQELTARHVRMLGEAGIEPQRTELAGDGLGELARRRQWPIDNRELFE